MMIVCTGSCQDMSEKDCVGLIEFRSVPIAVMALDSMVKAADVEICFAAPVCPGKYVAIIIGKVSAVQNSIRVGVEKGGIFYISSEVIPNINHDVFPALTGCAKSLEAKQSLGLLESMSAITAIIAADIATKSGNVQILEIRLARGLGGKSFLIITGEVSSVKSAIKSCEAELFDRGDIISTAVIAQPSPQLRDYI